MKNIVRAFVVALVITGAVASTQISSASAKTKTVVTKPTSGMIPMCDPSDPNACGIS